jgi:glutamate-1-semialdehyde 2,1-aminomutase
MNSYILLALPGVPLLVWILYRARLRLALSAAKHRSLAGHARWSRRIARLLPFYEYSEARFFAADEAPEAVAARRRAGFRQLAEVFTTRFARSAGLTGEVAKSVSDMQFTARYRVPFQFSRIVRENLKGGSFL